jgi:hypothetical protein
MDQKCFPHAVIEQSMNLQLKSYVGECENLNEEMSESSNNYNCGITVSNDSGLINIRAGTYYDKIIY